MKKIVGLVVLFSVSMVSASGEVSKREVKRLQKQALEQTLAYELVESLSMEVGPRLAGSDGDRAAVQWALAKLNALGFENVRAEPVLVPRWERGSVSVEILDPYPQPLVATALGGTLGTPELGVEAEVVHFGSLAELKQASSDQIEGKIVFLDQEMERHRDGRGYGVVNGNRTCGHHHAHAKGAVGLVNRPSGTSSARVPHTGSMNSSSLPGKIPSFSLTNADADILRYQLASENTVRVRLHSTARYLPDAISANVIGEVVGSEKPDEIVVLAAHLDSWDLGTGAIDDASGVGIVTTAAKLIMDSEQTPSRTLRVVLYANEEFGLSGARQYIVEHKDQVTNHVVGMEADFGAGKVWALGSQVPEESIPLIDELHALVESLGVERDTNQAFAGADLGPLLNLGMPVIAITQDGTDYFDYHHTPDDTLDKIKPDELNQNVAVYATAAYFAGNTPGEFGKLAPRSRTSSCE